MHSFGGSQSLLICVAISLTIPSRERSAVAYAEATLDRSPPDSTITDCLNAACCMGVIFSLIATATRFGRLITSRGINAIVPIVFFLLQLIHLFDFRYHLH